jgi:hypothetical protein
MTVTTDQFLPIDLVAHVRVANSVEKPGRALYAMHEHEGTTQTLQFRAVTETAT